MSFTPRILIKKSDLEKKRKSIELTVCEHARKKPDDAFFIDLYAILLDAVNMDSIKFLQREFIIIHPEFSGINQRVREWLHMNNVEHTIWN